MTCEWATRRRFLQGLGSVAVGSAVVAGASEVGQADSHESWPQFGLNDAIGEFWLKFSDQFSS